MSPYTILLLLAILRQAPSCCAGQNKEPFSGEGSTLEEEDWSGNSDTGEDDQLNGFDSGSSWTHKEYNGETTRESPGISRTYSSKRFLTSGDGEDNSGSREDDGPKSNSHGNEDYGSSDTKFDSTPELSKIVDAVDILKKLKKAKSDEELVKKLKTGPETLGVAFKTFEQLSGLWISVMHRIWRVWKAKGAKVVMHSIVDTLTNNTRRTIERKVEDFLSKNTSIPQEKVSINFIKNIPKKEEPWPSGKKVKTTIKKVKVSFTRKSTNNSSMNNTSNNTNTVEIDKGAKSSKTDNASFLHKSNVGSTNQWGKRNPLKMHKPLESGHYENTYNVSLDNSKNKVGKNRERGRTLKVTSTKERTENVSQHVDEKIHLQEKQADEAKVLNGQQKQDIGLLYNSFKSQNVDTQVTETSPGKNVNTTNGNVSIESRHGETNNSQAKMKATLERGGILEEANPTKNASKKSRVLEKVRINFLVKNKGPHLDQNNRNTSQLDTSRMQSKPISFVQNESNSKTDSKEKTAELSKSSHLTRNIIAGVNLLDKVYFRLFNNVTRNSTRSDIETLRAKKHFANRTLENLTHSPTNSRSQFNFSKIQTNNTTSFVQNKANLKVDSKGNATKLTESLLPTGDISRGVDLSDKAALGIYDNATRNSTKTDIGTPRAKEHFGNRTLENLAPTPTTNNNISLTDGFSENYKAASYAAKNVIDVPRGDTSKKQTGGSRNERDKTKHNVVGNSTATRNVNDVSEEDTSKKQTGGSHKTTNINVERDKTKHNIVGNSTQMSNKGVAKARSQAGKKAKVLGNRLKVTVDSSNVKPRNHHEDILLKKKTRNWAQDYFSQVLDNRRNVTTDYSNKKLQNDKQDVLAKERSQERSQEDSSKAERLDHSQTITANVNSALVLHTQEYTENHSSQEAEYKSQEEVRHDKREHHKIKTLPGTGSAALQTASRNLTAASKSTSYRPVRNSLSTTLALADERNSHVSKDGGLPPEGAFEGAKRDQEASPAESSRNSKTNSMVEQELNNVKVAEGKKTDTQENDARRGSGDTESNVKLGKERDTAHNSERGSGMSHGGSDGAQQLESLTTYGQKSALTKDKTETKLHGSEGIVNYDSTETVTRHDSQSRTINVKERTATREKLETIQRKTTSVQEDPEEGLLTDKEEGNVAHRPGSVVITGPHRKVQHDPERVSSKAKKATNGILTHIKFQKLAGQIKMSSRGSSKKPHLDGNDGSRRNSTENLSEEVGSKDDENETKKEISMPSTDTKAQDQTKEDQVPPKFKQVDVLTSRIPPTSLLTTSNDDNVYSIKEIVQGPKGPRLIAVHSDERRIHNLEKKVVRLENKVTVLETAMAGLARRLLDVENNTDHPIPTIPTFLPPPNEVKHHHKNPINNQQQTTVYITKDVSATPQTVAPQNGPEKIVIPISSLRWGGGRGVSTYPASIQEIYDNEEIEDNIRPERKLEDSTHVTVPLGLSSSPSSQAHAIGRPIVNIIVPNNRADVLSTEATCLPRCQNGGRCLEGNTCRCPTFFSGAHCEKFSLKDLLESPKLRERTYRKLRRVVLSELPDQQDLDGTLSLDSGSPTLEYRDLDRINEPDKVFVSKQQPVEVTPPRNSADAQGVTRRRQFILEI